MAGTFGGYSSGDGLRRELQADAGIALGEAGGWARVSAETQDNDWTNRSGTDVSPAARTDGTYGTRTHRVGAPALESAKVATHGLLPLGDTAELTGSVILSRRKTETAYGYQRRAAATAAIRPDGFIPYFRPTIDDASVDLGLRGELPDDWSYAVSLGWGQNRYGTAIESINIQLYRDTGSTPSWFENGRYDNRQAVLHAEVSRRFDLGLPGPLSFTAGVERQDQRYAIRAGEPASWYGTGAAAMPGISPADAGSWKRSSNAIFVDLDLKPVDRLTTTLALRHEDYSDFGRTLSGSLASRYDASRALALRGSVSNGFRAPSLAQIHYSSISTQGQDLGQGVVLVQSGTFPVDADVARLLGAQALKPEKSVNATLGLVWRPDEHTDVTVDAYRIDIDDRINLSSNFPVSTAVQNYLVANGVTGINYQSLRYLTNAVDTRTQGVDVVAQRRWALGTDRLTTTLSYGINRTRITRMSDNPAVLTRLGVPIQLVERREIGQLTSSNPEHKLILSADYALPRLGLEFHATATRYGSFWVLSNGGAATDQKFSHQWTADLSVSWRPSRAWRVSVGLDNAFDRRPDVVYNNSTNGSFPYTSYSPLSADGRFLYATARYSY